MNVLERSVILTTGSVLQVPALEAMANARPVTLQPASQPGSPSAERARILRALETSKRPDRRSGRRGGAARAEALDAAIPHAQIQHLTAVLLSRGVDRVVRQLLPIFRSIDEDCCRPSPVDRDGRWLQNISFSASCAERGPPIW